MHVAQQFPSVVSQDFATDGLRTLCLAVASLSEEQYATWSAVYAEASTALVNRGQRLDDAAEMIERDLFLLGATAIEDKLQVRVSALVTYLQQALRTA